MASSVNDSVPSFVLIYVGKVVTRTGLGPKIILAFFGPGGPLLSLSIYI